MLQKTFEIHQGKIPADTLHLEVGTAHIALTAVDQDNIPSRNFEFYSFSAGDDFEDVLSQIYAQSSFLKHDYKEVKVVWENPHAQYIPAIFHNDAGNDFVYSFAENNLEKQKRLLQKNDLFAIPFSTDSAQWNLLHKTIAHVKDSHKYFEILTNVPDYKNTYPVNMLVIFYPDKFIITAHKNGQLQLINSVQFSSGTDVVYYLLNTARQLDTDISGTMVTLCGLIDGDSILFQEIYKYIPHIDVDAADNATFLKENFGGHPSHFFVPFFKYV